jgi:hypothetical protein
MVTRLLLSLKKAAASQKHGWRFGEPTTYTTMRFAERRGDSTGDEIPLDTFANTHEETQSLASDRARDVTGDFTKRWGLDLISAGPLR